MAEVFINYRTGDGDEAAELIASQLSERFGKEHVFKAAHSIEPGDVYTQGLLDAARKCDVLLAIVGPRWDTAPQLLDEADWVRLEILTAHSFHASVIPVLKGRKTERLARNDLPPELRWIADVQSLRLDTNRSTDDIKRIGDVLAEMIPVLKAADRKADEAHGADANSIKDTTVNGDVTQARDVSGDTRNIRFKDTYGQTTIGDGNTQNNTFLTYISNKLKEFQQLTQPIEDLRRLAARFVPPPGFDAALATIKELRTVVLLGPPGSGRTATAKMLVFSSWPGGGILHELDWQESDDGSRLRIDLDLIGREDGIWVDLSEVDLSRWLQFQRQMPPLQKRVRELNARLVVIQPHGLELGPDFRHYLRRIEAPHQVKVFNHLLRAEGLANEECPATPDLLANPRRMADVRQFVEDILSAKEQAKGEGNVRHWITVAEQPTSPRETQASEALDRLPSSSDRALLLAVAMLHGAHADVIDRAAMNLLGLLPGEPESALTRDPLGIRLRKISAEIDTARHVRFMYPGHEAALRMFFWRHYPELHEMIATWVKEALDSDGLSEDDRTELARAFCAQCLDDRYRFRWTALVEHLTAKTSDQSREMAAAAILQMGLSHEASGRTFRRQIYDWSRAREKSRSLANVLVVACSQMSQTHPAEALVRLHHVARRHPQHTDAADALRQLAYRQPWLLGLLLSRITRRSPADAWESDATIFLDVADPAHFTTPAQARKSLLRQDEIIRQLTAGWALAFTRSLGSDWSPRANDWFTRAAGDDAHRHALINVLVDAARQAPGALPQLYALAHHGPFRDPVAKLVLERISTGQGAELS